MKDPIISHEERYALLQEALGGLVGKIFNKFSGTPPAHTFALDYGERLRKLQTNVMKMKSKYPKWSMYTVMIGKNIVWEMPMNLINKIFKLNDNGQYVDHYIDKSDSLGIKWLYDGVFEAESISMQNGILNFKGIWRSGTFYNGIIAEGSSMLGGSIAGGIYRAENASFRIHPNQFIYGGWSTKDGIFGFTYPSTNVSLNNVVVHTIKKGQFIELSQYGKKTVIHVLKGVDSVSLDMELLNIATHKKVVVDWQNEARPNFEANYIIKLDNPFHIAGLCDMGNVDSIVISDKYNAYASGGTVIGHMSKHKVKIDIKGLQMFSFLDILPGQEALYQAVLEDIENGNFLVNLKYLHMAINNGEIDGYGTDVANKYLFDSPGNNAMRLSDHNKKLMEYMVYFKKVIIDRMVDMTGKPNKVKQQEFIQKLRRFLEIPSSIAPSSSSSLAGAPPSKLKGKGTAKKGLTIKESYKSYLSNIL